MKKLLLSFLLISNLSFSQEEVYQLNNLNSYYFDYCLPMHDGMYYSHTYIDTTDNSIDYSLSYLPKNGQSGWKKNIGFPADFIPQESSILPCNLSNNLIVSILSMYTDYCLLMKIDPNGNVIWSKILNYPNSGGDYGSLSPLSLNDQDDITLTLNAVNRMVLTKLDTDGAIIFSKRINSADDSGNGKNPGFDAISTPDGGYLITMKNGSNPTVIKLDAALQVIWSKKWSIDSYSHPKLAHILPNGNYCIIGEGDNGTFIAQIDPNGNLLSYKYNLTLVYPYISRLIDANSIQLVDSRGTTADINLTNGLVSLKNYDELFQNTSYPSYTDQKVNLISFSNSTVYLNLVGSQTGCLNATISNSALVDLAISPGSIVNEPIVLEDLGSLNDCVLAITTTNDVSMTHICGNLGIGEAEEVALQLYPNPTGNGQNTTIEFEKPQGNKLQILTLSGKMIASYETNGAQKIVFNAPQQAGMYLVQTLDAAENVIAVEKLIVE